MPKPDNSGEQTPDERSNDPDELEAKIASALYLAGEALIADDVPTVPYAAPENDNYSPIVADFDWLKALVAQFRQALAEDPRRAELLRFLPQGLGDGDILRVLFGNLFPEHRNRRKQLHDATGKKKLTETQIEILRLTARGKTPTQIARERKCANANVTNILTSIEQRLNTSSPQESVVVALSMGYLPFDIMNWVNELAQCGARDYSFLDSLVSYASLESSADPLPWQELASFGLLLMLASATTQLPHDFAALETPLNGVLYRLTPRLDGKYDTQQVVGTGLLRNPNGLAIAPHDASKEGFTRGNLFIAHDRDRVSGMNWREIVEFTPEGTFVRSFCGSNAIGTNLAGPVRVAFSASGALLATSNDGLLRFGANGMRVRRLNGWCGVDVCVDAKELLYHARYSTRGGSIGVYTETGRLKREFAPLPPRASFGGVRVGGKDEVTTRDCFAALRVDDGVAMMLICDAETGDTVRCWRVPGATNGPFAFDVQADRLYVPCREPASIAVYTRAGTLQTRIAISDGVVPRSIALAPEGVLWLLGTQENAMPVPSVPLSAAHA